MQKAYPSLYVDIFNNLNNKNSIKITNNFFTTNEIFNIFDKKECFIFNTNSSIFILIPYHNKYYDLIYCSINIDKFYHDINSFINIYNSKYLIRASVLGKEPIVGNISKLFLNSGFVLNKKLGRVTFDAQKSDNAVFFVNSFQELSDVNNDEDKYIGYDKNNIYNSSLKISFAKISDAEEILKMLLEEFDMCGENVPELKDIKENIEKRQVAIIRKDNVIIAVNYFNVKNKIRYCIYEYVRKSFRSNSMMFFLNNFVNNHLNEVGQIVRTYGWRDVSKHRLIRAYQALGERFDGVYIYNHIYNADKEK